MNKNEIKRLKIESYGAFGEGVAHDEGMAVFVPHACVGEEINAQIVSVKKGYAYGKVIEVLSPSKDRVQPRCLSFKRCGGCDLQHLSYVAQLLLKRESVRKTLRNVGGIDVDVCPVVGSNKEYDCRNKLTLPFGVEQGKTVLGFYSERSHRVVCVESCALSNWSTKLISEVLDWANSQGVSVYDEKTGRGVLRTLSARVEGEKIMITLVATTKKVQGLEKLVQKLNQVYINPIIYLNVNDKDTNVVLGNKNYLLSGESKLKASAVGIKYELSPLSFAQVNDDVRDKLYSEVLANIEEDEIVVDAYSGAGVMSVLVSQKAKLVYGVEIVRDAVIDADKTAILNGKKDKIINTVGDCGVVLPQLFDKIRQEYEGKMTVILDPPRKGCDQNVLNAVKKCNPNKIIYVSCNPATLARDLKTLTDDNEIKFVKPFDMFPQTKHVETVVLLSNRHIY